MVRTQSASTSFTVDLSILGVIAERRHATDPKALALGGGDLVPAALGGDRFGSPRPPCAGPATSSWRREAMAFSRNFQLGRKTGRMRITRFPRGGWCAAGPTRAIAPKPEGDRSKTRPAE